MKLYEIDEAIYTCFDAETGEILDEEKLNGLLMAREQKLEGVALAVKNLTAEAKAIREEEKTLAERRQSLERKAESYKNWLDRTLEGSKFETARVKCSFRKSTRVEVNDNFVEWAIENNRLDLCKVSVPTPDKMLIKSAIQDGEDLPAHLIESNTLSIK